MENKVGGRKIHNKIFLITGKKITGTRLLHRIPVIFLQPYLTDAITVNLLDYFLMRTLVSGGVNSI